VELAEPEPLPEVDPEVLVAFPEEVPVVAFPVGPAWTEEMAPLGRSLPQSVWATATDLVISSGLVQAVGRQLVSSVMKSLFLHMQGMSVFEQSFTLAIAVVTQLIAQVGNCVKSAWATTMTAAPRMEAMSEVFIFIRGIGNRITQRWLIANEWVSECDDGSENKGY